MRASLKLGQHSAGFIEMGRFAEQFVLKINHCVSRNHEAFRMQFGDWLSLGPSVGLAEIRDEVAAFQCFLRVAGDNLELDIH